STAGFVLFELIRLLPGRRRRLGPGRRRGAGLTTGGTTRPTTGHSRSGGARRRVADLGDLQQEHQRRVCRDLALLTLTVGELRRDHDLTQHPSLGALETLREPCDDTAAADHDGHALGPTVRAVEL